MLVSKETAIQIDQHKPTMKNIDYLDDIPLEATVVSAKLDGEFTLLYHDAKQTFITNRYGTTRRNFPAVNEARSILLEMGFYNSIFKLEHYALASNSLPAKVNEFIHIAKSKPEYHHRLKFGYFDIVALNGIKPNMTYSDKLDLLGTMFKNATYNHVVPYIEPKTSSEIVNFWSVYVEKLGYEGIVVNSGSTTTQEGAFYKLKPLKDVDVVVLGINKKPKYEEQLVTSLKLGVMDKGGDFIVLGDVASGISHELREHLWKLTELKVDAMRNLYDTYMADKTLWIKPLMVIQVAYQELFTEKADGGTVEKDVLSYDGEKYRHVGTRRYPSLRHPRFTGIRSDKKVIYTDIADKQLL